MVQISLENLSVRKVITCKSSLCICKALGSHTRLCVFWEANVFEMISQKTTQKKKSPVSEFSCLVISVCIQCIESSFVVYKLDSENLLRF